MTHSVTPKCSLQWGYPGRGWVGGIMNIMLEDLPVLSHPWPSSVRVDRCVWSQADTSPSKLNHNTGNIAGIL